MTAMLGPHRKAKGDDTWLTPPWLLDALGNFDLDPCCPPNMPWRTADIMLTEEDDGLNAEWHGRVWLNPPYGKGIGDWLDKLARHGRGVALCFARTDTQWAQDAFNKCHSVLFIKGRLAFHYGNGVVAESSAGAPSMLLAYSSDEAKCLESNLHIPGVIFR